MGHSMKIEGNPRMTACRLVALLAIPLSLAGPSAAFAAAPSSEGGISFEEFQRNFAQAPIDLRVIDGGDAQMLLWTLPPMPPASAALAYDPVIDHFRIYRMDPAHGPRLVGETRATYYEVEPARSGTIQRFAVTTVQRSGQESGFSNTVVVRFP